MANKTKSQFRIEELTVNIIDTIDHFYDKEEDLTTHEVIKSCIEVIYDANEMSLEDEQ